MARKLLLYSLDFYQKNPDKVAQEVRDLIDESKTEDEQKKIEDGKINTEEDGEEKELDEESEQ